MATETPNQRATPPPILEEPPLLSIETEVTLPQFRVDGRPYGLKRRQDLTLREDARVTMWVRRLVALDAQPFDEETAIEVSTLRDRICRVVVAGMSDEEHQALTDDHRGVIVGTFCLLLRTQVAIEAAAGAHARLDFPTSANSSPPSPASTAVVGING